MYHVFYLQLWSHALRLGIAVGLAWAVLFWKRWMKRRRENIAQSWPTVEAVILNGKVTPINKTTRFLATLQYSYRVDEYRSGKYTHEFQREADADDFIRQMKDKRVQIRYNQSNPDKSVLEQSAVEQMVMLTPRFG